MNDGITGRAGFRRNYFPICQVVRLEHHTVDVVGQTSSQILVFLVGADHLFVVTLQHLLYSVTQPPKWLCRQPPSLQLLQNFRLSLKLDSFAQSNRIKHRADRAF